MKIMLAAAAIAALTTATPALAQVGGQPSLYGTVGVQTYNGAEDGGFNLGAATARVGARIGSYFGVEGEGSVGIGSEEIGSPIGPIDYKLDSSFGAYVTGFLPVSPEFELIGRVGVATARIGADSRLGDVELDGNGIAVGVGAQYFFDGVNGVRGDYTRLEFEEDDDADIQSGAFDVFGVSYVRRF